MPIEAWITLVVLIGVLTALFTTNRAPDAILWFGVIMLMVAPVKRDGSWLFGVLAPTDALAGLANEGVVTIAAMFIVAAGLKETGALNWISQILMGTPRSLFSAQNRIVWPTACMSAFMNNTPLVAMLMPVVNDWSNRYQLPISKLLMPLSFASILGGACTLIGTSTNLIVNGWIIKELDHPGMTMFELGKVGLPIAMVGILYILFTQRWLLKDRKPPIHYTDDAKQYTVEMVVEEGWLDGKTIQEAGLRGLPGLYLIEISRDGDVLPAVSPGIVLKANDRLVFAGVVESVVDLQRFNGLRVATNQVFKLNDPRHKRVLIEAVVSNTSPLIGKSIREGQFRTVYNAAIIAVARNGEHVNKKIGDIVLQPGDVLLLEARRNFIEQQRNNPDFYLMSQIEDARPVNKEKASLALLLMLGLVGVVMFGMLSILQAAIIVAGIMVLSNCCTASVARKALDLQTLLVIAGAIGLGNAMKTSGLAGVLGMKLLALGGAEPITMLVIIFVITMVFGNLVTAKAGAVLMLPLATAVAAQLQVSYMPFVIAVMLASATSLATPISYPTNLMVFGTGGYRFNDYLRFGGPLSLLVIVIAVWLIPLYWPF